MENRKVEISLQSSVTVGAGNAYTKEQFFVALGAEPTDGETREQVAALLFADARSILEKQTLLSSTKLAGSASQTLVQAKADALDNTAQTQAQVHAAPSRPAVSGIDDLDTCQTCGNGIKNTPGNAKALAYSKERGYPPMCYKCKVAKGIIKAPA